MKAVPAVIFVLLLLLPTASACTIFSADDGHQRLAGNNGDFSDPHTYIAFYPASSGKFGRVYCGWRQFWWQTGMNDQGLCFASASTTYREVINSSQKPHYSGYLMYKCMEECATVSDVLAVFDQYNLDFLERLQLLVTDATGASVIIEGDPLIFKEDYYQVVTNFRLSQTNPPYPCWRYNTAVSMFENVSVISPDFFAAMCNATHQEGQSPTQFSTVYDLLNLTLYLYSQHDYTQVRVFNLSEELALGYHSYSIPGLFNTSLPPLQPARPQGRALGKIGHEYTYTTTTADPEGDEVWYWFEWGDCTNSSWLGPYASGEECAATHTWTEKCIGTPITVKAKDASDAESPWSDPLPVIMPLVPHSMCRLLIQLLLTFLANHHASPSGRLS